MNTKSKLFRLVDLCLLGMILLPLVAGIALQVLTQPVSGGLEISGAYIYCTIPLPFQELPITESQVNSWLVMVSVLGLCLYLTHGIAAKAGRRRQQLAAEWIVEKTEAWYGEHGGVFQGLCPFYRRHHGAFGLFQLADPDRPVSADVGPECGGRLGAAGLFPHHASTA